MLTMQSTQIEEIEQEIMDYLKKCPNAGFDIEGISLYWVKPCGRYKSLDQVEKAVKSLCEKGLMRQIDCISTYIYGLSKGEDQEEVRGIVRRQDECVLDLMCDQLMEEEES